MLRKFFLLSCILSLAACGGGHDRQPSNILTPLPASPNDPPDSAIKPAVAAYVAGIGAPAASQFSFVRYDLNNDGLRDALVLMKSPYGYWCGDDNGCALLVLRAGNDNFTVTNKIQPLRPPVYVAHSTTNGWRDLIGRVSGRQAKAKDVIIRYNGVGYPIDPSRLPAYTLNPFGNHIRVFVD